MSFFSGPSPITIIFIPEGKHCRADINSIIPFSGEKRPIKAKSKCLLLRSFDLLNNMESIYSGIATTFFWYGL